MKHAGNPTGEQLEKLEKLKVYIGELDSVAVAFSGGVDSALLLRTAHDVLGAGAIAVTVRAPFVPERETQESRKFCTDAGICQYVCEVSPEEIEGFAQNPKNRCYLCKKVLFGRMMELAEKQGAKYVLEGSNLDDMGDYRPGLQAVEELGVKSPLRACALTKQDIRVLSKHMGLPTWKKPSFACLASRFAYGQTISQEGLQRVDAAEQILLEMGFSQFRVRVHGELARIEVLPEEFPKLLEEETRVRLTDDLKKLGFTYVAMDLAGYRTGSMNETL